MQKSEDIFVQVAKEIELMEPYAASHGGKIELVTVQDYNVVIRLQGTCSTCPLSFYTVTFGIEQRLQKSIDQQIRVIVQD